MNDPSTPTPAAPATSRVSAPSRALAALGALRARLRRLFLADGLVTIGGGAAFAALASFALDYLLALPRPVRLVLLAAAGLALLHHVRRRIARPLARPIPDADLASLVERANPELVQSLITAVELTRPGSEAAAYVSPSLLDRVVRDVEERVSSIRFDRVFDLSRLRKKTALLTALALVIVAGAALEGEMLSIWFSRNVLLSAERWPKQTRLELVSPDPSRMPALVAMGDELEIFARAVRGSPSSGLVRITSGDRLLRVDSVSVSASGELRKVIENVSRPFQFSVTAGDDEIGPFDVEVRLRPRIDSQSIEIWCTFPAYTGYPSTPDGEPLRHGNLKVPEGTKVRFRMASNVDIERAYFVFRTASAPESRKQDSPAVTPAQAAPAAAVWPDAGAVELPLEEGRRFHGELTVTESGQYYFQLEAKGGFRSVKPDRFRVEAVPDQKPVVKILEPERVTEEVSPDAEVLVRVSASDDYRIQKGTLEGTYFPPGKDAGTNQSFELPRFKAAGEGPATPPEAGGSQKVVEDEVLVRIASLDTGGQGPPGPGARFQYSALAMDFAGKVGDSPPRHLSVVDKDDLLRILSDQLTVVRDQLAEASKRQKSARKDLEELSKQADLTERVQPKDASKLVRHRQDQERVVQALGEQVLELDRILARTAKNKVGDEKWRAWVSGVRDDVAEVARKKAPEVTRKIDELKSDATKGAAEARASRLGAIAGDQRDVEREIDAIVMRLSEFGDVNAVIQMLLDVRRREFELREEIRSRVKAPGTQEPQK